MFEPPDDPELETNEVHLGRSYVRLLWPVVLCVALVAFGVLGREFRTASSPPTSPSAAWSTGIHPVVPIAPVQPDASIGVAAEPVPLSLGPGVTTSSLAVANMTLYYVANGEAVMALPLVDGGLSRALLAVPACHEIESVAIDSTSLLYVERSPLAQPAGSACPARGFEWQVQAKELSSGATRKLAAGADPGAPPWVTSGIRIAVSGKEFAIAQYLGGQVSSVGASGKSRVEVRSVVDSTLLWATDVAGSVDRIMLRGNRLAILTAAPRRELYVASADAQRAAPIAEPATGANLSVDGRFVTWDSPPSATDGLETVQLADLVSGTRRAVGSAAAPPEPETVQPVVGVTDSGPVIAWFTYFGGGWTIPSFVDASHPEPIPVASRDAPVWLGIEAGTLIWVVVADDHVGRALVADLETPRPRP